MENELISPTLIYLMIGVCFFGLGYLYVMYKSFKKRVSLFCDYRRELYEVKNSVQYHELYEKIVRWSMTLGQYNEETRMREELFTLLKNRKDHLGIKKNVKIVN